VEKSLYGYWEIWFGWSAVIVEGCLRKLFFVFCSVLLVVGLSMVVVVPVGAWESFVWEGDVYSSGVPVASSPLSAGTSYRFVASEIWFYDNSSNLAADAQYYTMSGVDSWDWLNSQRPDHGHSFLQVNEHDVDWGAFSNGDSNHTYSLYFAGAGAAVAFRIFDWVDQDVGNNVCHVHVRVFEEVTVGGRVVDSGVPSRAELMVVALLVASAVAVPLIVYFRKA
jgi:hypothetical protein